MERLYDFAERMGINPFPHNCYICFIITWIYYNSYYNEFKHNNKKKDYKKATNELNFSCGNEKELLSRILNEFQSIEGPKDVMKNGKRVGVINMRNEKRVDMAGSDLKKILLMIYQIRCNLIHGDKMRVPYETDEQLLKWASSSLIMLMNKSN